MPEFGPDGNLYVVDGGVAPNGVDASVVRFDGATGEFIDYFVLPGSRRARITQSSSRFDPNGRCLYSHEKRPRAPNRSRIATFDGSTGAYLGDFVAGSGARAGDPRTGVWPGRRRSRANGDPDGVPDLFVTSNLTHEVLAFSGADGQPLGPFVTAGSGGLDSPHGLTFHDIDDDGVPELFVVSSVESRSPHVRRPGRQLPGSVR